VSVLEVPAHYNPHWVFESNKEGLLRVATGEDEIIPRRQELPKAYFRDGGIYITSKEVLIGMKSFLGKKLGYIKSNPKNYVNIDNQEDWNQALAMLESRTGM
jgi:CMP-N-acetylneuraminic acid synthetase